MTREQRLLFYADRVRAAERLGERHLWEVQRELCRTDLFYLLVFVLKRRDLNRNWSYDRCAEVQRAPDGYLDLWAREHGKSSIITFGKTIQDVLCDPEITIGIFSHNRPAAKAFLRQIKLECESNAELQALFPDILWANAEKDAPKWSEDDGLIFRRAGNPKEATIEAWGLVDGMPTGRHFRLRVYDDLITQGSVTNPDMIRKVTEAWELSIALGQEGGTARYIGTRYHFNDPYREIINRGAAIPRIYPCTTEGSWPGTPVLMSPDELTQRRKAMGVYSFSSQMLLDPSADKAMGFKRDWLRYYEGSKTSGAGMNKYLLVDAASAKKKESDYTAMGIIGLATDGNYYLLDGVRDRLNLKERADALFSLHRRWRPLGVGYEKYGMQADIEFMQLRMADENYHFGITELGGQVAKPDRIRRMVPIFEAGQFWMPDSLHKTDYEGRIVDLTTQFVEEEYVAFPVGLHDDFFDMLSRIMDEKLGVIWPKTAPPEDRYAKPKRRADRTRLSHMAA